MTDADTSSGAGAKRRTLRPLSLAVLVGLLAFAVALTLLARGVLRDQERRLLRERTNEVNALLGSAIGGIESSLRTLGAATGAAVDPVNLFQQSARPLLQGNVQTIAVAEQQGTGWVVRAAVGRGPAAGAALTGPRAALVRRAVGADGLVSDLFEERGATRVSFAIARGAPTPVVVYQESTVNPTEPTPSTPESPFRELEIVLYASPRAERDRLLLTTTRDLPLSGLVEREAFPVGADEWLTVASAREPLIGSFAEAVPWMILAGGLVAALLATATVETLARRRAYAEAVVHTRTAELRQAVRELEEAQTQLVRQERLAAVGQLASAIGHELRNPLGVIMNVLYLLETDLGDGADERAHRHLGTARRELSAATLIVSDLLDYSAAREPMRAPVDVHALVDETLSVAPPPSGVQVASRGDEQLPPVNADRDQLRQVLLNLVTNGYEAMPDGGLLTVETAAELSAVSITVSDTGVGMDEDTKAQLFTPFFTGKARGIGLGLAVTKRIVEAHGGTVSVDSRPGAGSSFRVVVPVSNNGDAEIRG